MKVLYAYFGIVLALLLLPGGTDVGKLAPSQVVYVQSEGVTVTVSTDLGNYGTGSTIDEAFYDLEKTTPGKVFLDTAEYLLVGEGAESYLSDLSKKLKQDCQVCSAAGLKSLSDAAMYLKSHNPGVKLGDLDVENVNLPFLIESRGRFCLKNQKIVKKYLTKWGADAIISKLSARAAGNTSRTKEI